MPYCFFRQFFGVGYSLGGLFILIKRYYSIVVSNKLIIKHSPQQSRLSPCEASFVRSVGLCVICPDFLCEIPDHALHGLHKLSSRAVSIAQTKDI
jgi:hypothetical protein